MRCHSFIMARKNVCGLNPMKNQALHERVSEGESLLMSEEVIASDEDEFCVLSKDLDALKASSSPL